jgi:hypothetical protein
MFNYPLHPGEKVVEVYRQTEWVLIKPLLIIVLGIYLPWYFLLKYEIAETYFRLLLFWSLILLAYGLFKYILWLVTVYIVTNDRLVLIKYYSLFNKRISENELDKAISIGVHNPGLLATMLNFGNVEIRMANIHEPVILNKVRDPKAVKELIWTAKGDRHP